VLYRMAVSPQTNLLTTLPSPHGSFACPNHGGGVEWNGGFYDPATNAFLIPSTLECATWKVTTTAPVPYVAGQPYSAGPLPKRRKATGMLTPIDIGTGKCRWHTPFAYPAQGGVTIVPGELAFTSDVRGRIYAIDAASGKELWHDDTDSAIVAPISAYRIAGNEYLAVFAGRSRRATGPSSRAQRSAAQAVTFNRTCRPTQGAAFAGTLRAYRSSCHVC